MKRKQVKKEINVIEDISRKCFKAIGIRASIDQSNLFARIFISGLAHYFFNSPDDIIEMGFLKIEKRPIKEEVFRVTLSTNKDIGVINAETLWKYYTGELLYKTKFKKVVESFMKELINYSKIQEKEITEMIEKSNREGDLKNGF